MQGFVRNETGRGKFKLKKSLTPGSKLDFDYAYLVVGEKSGEPEGPSFIKWLKDNYFKNKGWVFYKKDNVLYFPDASGKEVKVSGPETLEPSPLTVSSGGSGKRLRKKGTRARTSDITPKSIIEADFPRAKELIDKCHDRGVIKKAISLSNHFARKEEHRRNLMRRLDQVY